MVALLRGADELVIRAVQPLDHCLEPRHVAFEQLAGSKFLFCRRLQHFHAVLVRAGEKEHVISFQPHESGYGIGGDRFVRVADMRRAIGVGDGRRNVVARLVSHQA